MPTYTVKEGECLTEIADVFGMFWETIWYRSENQAVRDLRGNPNVLMPGDRLFIPDKREKEEACATTEKHTFRIRGIPAKVVFRLLDAEGEPRSGLRYTLKVDAKEMEGTVQADGVISHVIPPQAREATLVVHLPDGDEEEYPFDLGGLNPVEDVSGVRARLINLGYLDAAPAGGLDDEAKQAIRLFQEAEGLPVTGEADDATRKALLARHGS